jgi:alpha-tubulin suppressor-like RCC1 family protein
VGVCIYCQSDSECTSGTCVPTLGCSSNEQLCSNGLDDDGDSAIDCADTDCATDTACQTGVVAFEGAGVFHNCVTTLVGTTRQVKCWGRNNCGQLGYQNASAVPTVVTGLTSPTQVRGGFCHSCALESDGTVKCWGTNVHGEYGNGNFNPINPAYTPKVVPGLSGVKQIAADGNTNCAVLNDGTLMCWGQNDMGQVGNGSPFNVWSPSTVMTGVASVAVGAQHTCAVLTNSNVRCWGRNHQAQLGKPC